VDSPALTVLNLLPPVGYPVIVGDRAGGGVFRPLVVADQAYQTRAMQEVLLVAAAPAITADAWLGNLAFYPVNTDNTKAIVGLVSQLTFTGTNLGKGGSTDAFAAELVLNGSAAFPASATHPTAVMDCNAVLGASFSGSIAQLAGLTPDLIYTAGGTGTVTDYYGIYFNAAVAVASKITNYTGLYLPTPPTNITNYYPIQFGGGKILSNGAVTWAAASDLVPLAIQGASGQTADLLRLQSSVPTTLAKFDSTGKLFIDHLGQVTTSHNVVSDNILDLTKGAHLGNSAINLLSEGLGIRASAWTGDAGWILFHNAADTSADYGLTFYNIASSILILKATSLTCIDAFNFAFGTTTGTKLGTATNQKIGMFNATPVVQAAHIADSAGVLVNAHAAINAILVVLENLGPVAKA
jgi:hypothetical protein